jgi:hypothetical protein
MVPIGSKVICQQKTYNSRYSLVAIHLTTNPPVAYMNRADPTGSFVGTCSATIQVAELAVSSIAQYVNGSINA